MYPILILRSEVVCLVILTFLYFTARAYTTGDEGKAFNRIIILAVLHVVFDGLSVLTVNNLDTCPAWLNLVCHMVFYVSAILFANEILNYVFRICYPDSAGRCYISGIIITIIYVLLLPLLEFRFIEDIGTYSSAGTAASLGYGLAFIFFLSALLLIFAKWNDMPVQSRTTLIPMMVVLIITEVCQLLWKSLLFTGASITIVTVGMFFSLENPIAVFKQKAMLDALTGVRSRRSCDEDIKKFDESFQKNPSTDYIFVFIDINDLHVVNNQFGHSEGDNYITLVSSSIKKYMTHAYAVYRIGGDEFLVLYYKVDSDVVEKEIRDVQDACKKASESLEYTAAVAAGYAQSSDNYKRLNDVVNAADYAMYQNKVSMKTGSDYGSHALGTKINYTGLTDKIFDAMCASSNTVYPFITNLETNVTRIDPQWKEYFGLEDEFFADFMGVWTKRISPEDLDGYLADIVEVINGHKKYHHYDYMAKKADGTYVKVSCSGSLYRDAASGISYFSGSIVNHGMEDNTDPGTGLENFDMITARISRYMDEGRPFSILKLAINNLARINMLYGYDEGIKLIKKVADILKENFDIPARVYSQDTANLSVVFDSNDAEAVEHYYNTISDILSNGIETEAGIIPLQISGGALVNNGEYCPTATIRSRLVYAVEESHYNQRNKLVFYREIDDASQNANINLLSDIHADALAEMKYFWLRYQPIMNMQSGKVSGAEALLRWVHPDYGEVQPGRFIEFLENDP